MFKRGLSFLCILAIALQTFTGAGIVLNYYTNTAAYARNCENKSKPMLHCNGRCQMLKKLKQEQNKDKQNPERKNDSKNEVISSKSFFASIRFLPSKHNRHYPFFNNLSVKDISIGFFHPPGKVSVC